MAKRKRLNRRNIALRGSTRRKFVLRKDYLNNVVPTDEYDNFFDASLMPYYGKADKKGNVIYPSETYLVPLVKNTKFSADTVYAMNFVFNAFTDLQNYFNKANQIGVLFQEVKNIQTINPVKGWQSVHTKYATHIQALYRSLLSSYLEKPSEKNGLQRARPKNFQQYMTSVKDLYETKGNKFPLSRSSYILSNKCPMHISGLVIEITPALDYSDDVSKNFTYIESPNFKFYMNALKKFGFMADKDYPGRIIADLGSPKMQEYMGIYGISLDNLFDSYYHKAKNYDYDLVRTYLIQFYSNYVSLYPVVSEITGKSPIGTTNTAASTKKLIERTPLTETDLETKYDQNFWISTYIEFLNYELRSPLDNYELQKTIKNAKDLNKNVDFDAAMGYIGNKFNFYRYPVNNLALVNYEHDTKISTT